MCRGMGGFRHVIEMMSATSDLRESHRFTARAYWVGRFPTKNPRPGHSHRTGPCCSVSEKRSPGSLRQNRPPSRQHVLNRLPDPQGQRSFRPSFSSSSLSPWTILSPRLTCISDGNPRRRLLIVSKGHLFLEFVGLHGAPPVRVGELACGETCHSVHTHRCEADTLNS